MKKIKFIFIIIWMTCFLPQVPANDFEAEFRVAGFFHTSKKFRDIYGDVGPSYAIEVGMPIYCSWNGWANIDWFQKHKKIDCYSKSDVGIVNGSFGAKYNYEFCPCWNLYLGAGLSLGGIFLENKSDSLKDNASKFLIGGVIKSAVTYIFYDDFFADAFLDYLYQPAKFHHTIDIGGFKLGLGLGYRF